MAVTTGDQLIAATLGVPYLIGKDSSANKASGIQHTPWYGTGSIGAGAAPTGGLNGATFTATSGAFTGAVSMPPLVAGAQSYVERLSLTHIGGIGTVWLIDRQWGNVPVVTTTGAQAITSPTWVARDASASTNGAGVYLALETSSATGNVGAITNTTVSYTNSANVAGRTATLASFPATANVGTWVLFSLQAGDVGVRSVQSITLGTSYVSGQVHLMAFRLVCTLQTPNSNSGNDRAWVNLALPRVWNDSVLQLVYWPTGTSCGAVAGEISFAQG